MKVIHLFAPASFGGLERVVYALSVGQKKKNHDVVIVALLESAKPEPSIVDELRRAGLHVISVSLPPRSYLRQRRSILGLCQDLSPDVLHSHGYLADVLAASLGATFRAIRVTTVHGFTGGGWRNRLYEWMERRSFARFDAVVVVSHKLARELAFSGSGRKLMALPNAWTSVGTLQSRESALESLGIPSDAYSIGWIGRISREKGADVLLEALPHVRDLPIRVSVIGEGEDRTKLERRAQELRVANRVSWRGEVPRAARLLRAFDLLVISSRTEGTPITLFEAMDAGIPIVATSVGGVPDVVSSREAELVRSEDPVALASAIRRVHDAPEDARARAVHARTRLEKDFAAGPWIDSYDRVYEKAIAHRSTD